MDFEYSLKTREMITRLKAFMVRHVLPANQEFHETASRGEYPLALLDRLKARAFEEGLWNLFLPDLEAHEPGTRLTNLEYAPLAEIMGRVYWSSEVFNCSAPDTGNMEILKKFGTAEQKKRWLAGSWSRNSTIIEFDSSAR